MRFQRLSLVVPFLATAMAAQENHLYCDMIELDPKPEPARCGALVSPSTLDRLISTPVVRTKMECARACHRKSDCSSWTWEHEQMLCRLFDATADQMPVSESLDGSTRFYNRKCHVCLTRRFYLTATSDDDTSLYHEKNIVITPTGSNQRMHIASFGDDSSQFTLFNIYEDGTLTMADQAGMNSYTPFDFEAGTDINEHYSNVRFLTDLDAAAHKSAHVPVHCAIDRSFNFNCWSDSGSFFYGCSDPKRPHAKSSGLMLTEMMMSSEDLHSKNCSPINLRVTSA